MENSDLLHRKPEKTDLGSLSERRLSSADLYFPKGTDLAGHS